MWLTVETWCQYAAPEIVLDTFKQMLSKLGFEGSEALDFDTSSWDVIQFTGQKIFVRIGFQTKHHLNIEVCGNLNHQRIFDRFYVAFEKVFLSWLDYARLVCLTEVIFSIRNPQPYPFLTFADSKTFATPVLVDHAKTTNRTSPLTPLSNRIQYWETLGPELHFIAHHVFERTRVDVVEYAKYLSAWMIQIESGVIFDCGWTDEFALPKVLAEMN